MTLESQLLGCLIQHPELLDDLTELRKSDFETERHRRLYGVLVDLHQRSEPVNLLTVHKASETAGYGIDAAWLSTLTTEAVIPDMAEWTAREVIDAATRRQVMDDLTEIMDAARHRETPAEDILASLTAIIEHSERDRGDYLDVRDMIPGLIETIKERYERHTNMLGLATGIDGLDAKTLGLQPGMLYILAARASIGKTALALTLAANVAEVVPVGFLSLEMSSESLAMRLLSMISRIPTTNLITGFVHKSKIATDLHMAMEDLSRRSLYIMDRPRAWLREVVSTARRMRRREKIECLFIDYGGLIRTTQYSENRVQQVNHIVKEMKQLSADLNLPIVLLAQLNRHAEGKRPSLAELKESGAYEEDADVVILLNRDRDSEDAVAEVDVAKNRHGPTGRFKTAFLRESMLFANLSRYEDS